MRSLFSIALLVAMASPVLACVNYTESANHEREFKSQYQESNYQPPEPEQVSSSRSYVLGGAGMVMAVAGLGLFLRLRSQLR
jgi:hypothetical protein